MKHNDLTLKLIKGLHLLVTATLLAGLALTLTPVPVVHAAIFDIPDGDVTALINAISTANGNAAPDVINLYAGGTYILIAADNDTDGPNGLPSFTTEVIINGNGATIQRNSSAGTPDFRILHVGSNGDLTVNDLTIRNGKAGGGQPGSDGGGIFNSGNLTLNNSTVKENNAGAGGVGGDGGSGGGIYNSGTLTLDSTTVSDNSAGSGGLGSTGSDGGHGGEGGLGGGVCNAGGLVELTNSTVSGNSSGAGGNGGNATHYWGSGGDGGNGGNGGGIHHGGGTTHLANSTVSGNTTGSGGDEGNGGVDGIDGDGGNGGNGGGIHQGGGTTQLINSTISGNSTGNGDYPGVGGDGGGIFETSGVTTYLKNTILAGNSADGSGPDCYASTLDSQDYNLVQDITDCTLVGTITHNITGEDPKLGALALNPPGNTETHALLATSPALDHIPGGINGCGTDITDDQRGVGRPQGGGCDIGAFEVAGAGTIIVEKRTDPDGTPGTFDFAADIGSPVSFSLSDGETETLYAWPGSHTVSEADPAPHFELIDITCSDGNSTGDVGAGEATIDLEASETVTCTFTNAERGTVVIQKRTDPPGGAGFAFTHDVGAGGSFDLDDGGSEAFYGVALGTYTVTEGDPTAAGFELTDLVCVESGTPNSTADLGNRQATIDLDAGETVICTFENSSLGSVEVCKDAVPDDASVWDFDLGGPTPGTEDDLGDGDCRTFSGLLPGFYTLSESVQASLLTTVDCGAKGSDNDDDISFTLDPGEDVTCTFTNSEPATLVIGKRVDSGVLSSNLTFEIPDLAAGVYPVTEDSPTMGVDLTAIVCDDGGGATPSTGDVRSGTATFGLDPGETVTCVFTNSMSVAPTGGASLPMSRLKLLTPWIELAALASLAALTIALARRRAY